MLRRLPALFVPIALLALLALLAPALPAAAQTAAPESAALEAARALRQRWAEEVRDLRVRERDELAALRARAAAAHGSSGFAAAQRDLEAAKGDWRLRVLDAQLRYARAAGKPESANRIEERMRAIRELAARRAAPAGERGGR